MSRYLQEQSEELEALSFIFPEEFQLLSNTSCEICIKWEFIQEIQNSEEMELTLKVNFPAEYPDQPCDFSLKNPQGPVSHQDLIILKEDLNSKIHEFLGLAMVFNIVEFIKSDTLEIIKSRIEKEIVKDQVIITDLSNLKAGTRVTKESFEKWKLDFSNEISHLLNKNSTLSNAQNDFAIIYKLKQDEKKVTGRQLFEKDVSLAMADLNLVDESEGVSVDLALFQGIEGLGHLEEEEENQVLALLEE